MISDLLERPERRPLLLRLRVQRLVGVVVAAAATDGDGWHRRPLVAGEEARVGALVVERAQIAYRNRTDVGDGREVSERLVEVEAFAVGRDLAVRDGAADDQIVVTSRFEVDEGAQLVEHRVLDRTQLD